MNIPEQVTKLANAHGFNSVELIKRTAYEYIYSVGSVDADGFALPVGLPHYIIDRNGLLSLVCDEDFHITSVL